MAAVYVDDAVTTAGAAVAPRDSSCPGPPDRDALPARPVVLIIEPDPLLRRGIADALDAHGMEVVETADGLGALLELSHRAPDMMVLDMDLSQVSGHRVFCVLRSAP